jgi:hypothetical protein
MQRFCVTQFEYDATRKVFSQEVSTLRCGGISGRIVLHNPATGADAEFVLDFTDMDSSREDTYGWNFKPTMGAVQDNPRLAGVRLLIIND